MKKIMLEVVIEKDRGGYFAYCPVLQGCYTQGETYEEVIENIKDAIRLHLEDRKAAHETLPSPESISVTTLELTL
jgi:predicted RNase H-like HicB family nuclease